MMFSPHAAPAHHRSTPPTPSSVASATTSTSNPTSSSKSAKQSNNNNGNAEVRSHKRSLAASMKNKFQMFFTSVTNSENTLEEIIAKPRDSKPGADLNNIIIGEPVVDLRLHVAKLQKPLPQSQQTNDCSNGCDLEFDSLSKFDFQIRRTSGVFATAQRSCNVAKNRFKNILANENTRVKLQVPNVALGEEGEELSDYINANFIEGRAFHLTLPDNSNYINQQNCNNSNNNNNNSQQQQPQLQQQSEKFSGSAMSLSSSLACANSTNSSISNSLQTNPTTIAYPSPPYPVPEGSRYGNVRYIAAQAPVQQCIGEFYQMMWEQDVGSIISLANEIQDQKDADEDMEPPTPSHGGMNGFQSGSALVLKKKNSFFDSVSSNKVQKYWPSVHLSQTYGDITVTTTEETHIAQYEIFVRKIEMKRPIGQLPQQQEQEQCQPQDDEPMQLSQPSKNQQDAFFDEMPEDTQQVAYEIKHITMYHYVGWPDMGVPKTSQPILYLLKKLDKFIDNVPNPRPILVHCNAGVGRTGTFLNVHLTYLQMKEYLAAKKLNPQLPPFKFNIYETSKILKQMRLGMIQKKEQYLFCYTTILAEASTLGVLGAAQPPADLLF